ncbi:DUF3793 family protein [Clostridium sp. B9]|uniref:DUF3793 family protein n=1 Tax=Clostridium sp. B9 TaxID=3423224 RepID=UPI003D2ED817
MNNNFLNLLESLNNEKYMRTFISYLISPVITGIKPSSTITLSKQGHNLFKLWNMYGDDLLKDLQLKHVLLRETSNAKVILIYDEINLMNTIYNRNSMEFLEKLGYNLEMTLDDILKHLVNRYSTFHCPHELGIFLGIPVKDVKCFMECSESKCLLCGYWKVYEEEHKAQKIFELYDSSKEIIMNHLLIGKDLKEVYNLTNNVYKFNI